VQQGETEAHDGIVSAVEKIAHLKRKSLNADTRTLEREIDQAASGGGVVTLRYR